MSALDRSDLVEHLASIVGREKASDLVDDAARAVGGGAADPEQASRILDHLASIPGAVGVSARLLRQRARSSGARLTPDGARDPIASSMGDHPNVGRLVHMLAPSVGDERASELVDEAIALLHHDRRALDRGAALAVLESLATRGGLIGTVARFAKARAHFELSD